DGYDEIVGYVHSVRRSGPSSAAPIVQEGVRTCAERASRARAPCRRAGNTCDLSVPECAAAHGPGTIEPPCPAARNRTASACAAARSGSGPTRTRCSLRPLVVLPDTDATKFLARSSLARRSAFSRLVKLPTWIVQPALGADCEWARPCDGAALPGALCAPPAMRDGAVRV